MTNLDTTAETQSKPSNGKSIYQLVEENPDFIKEREADNRLNFYENGKHFFQQADVPKMLEVLKNPQVWEAINKAGFNIKKSVEALQRFAVSYHDTKESAELTKAWKNLLKKREQCQ